MCGRSFKDEEWRFMDRTEGLKEYVASKEYRKALGLPEVITEEYRMLAQGEYNRNYVFCHPVSGQKLVLRINFGSQMHLKDQIGYEYQALKLLAGSGRTPRPLYVDGSRRNLPYGVMVMEFLPGHSMVYETELLRAAGCLADIHSVRLPQGHGLICPKSPLKAILEECEEMVRTYMESELADHRKKEKIRRLLDMGWKKADDLGNIPYYCCINTELNSTNFLINEEGKDYLIDWEKPLYGDPAQDLGHFLAPTTTFWKTDVILDREQTEKFIHAYIREVNGRFDISGIEDRTKTYIQVTCLRGITWCAMAWIEYQQPDKEIFNLSTFQKLEAYLDDDFLDQIESYVNGRQEL